MQSRSELHAATHRPLEQTVPAAQVDGQAVLLEHAAAASVRSAARRLVLHMSHVVYAGTATFDKQPRRGPLFLSWRETVAPENEPSAATAMATGCPAARAWIEHCVRSPAGSSPTRPISVMLVPPAVDGAEGIKRTLARVSAWSAELPIEAPRTRC